MNFDQVIYNYRMKNGLTQREVVESLNQVEDFRNLNVISYHRWESGKVVPHVKKQAKIFLHLGMRNELQQLCLDAHNFDKVVLQYDNKRWKHPRSNFQDPYDFKTLNDVNITTVAEYNQIPEAIISVHSKLYFTDNSDFQYRDFFNSCQSSNVTIFHDEHKYYGHYAVHELSLRAFSQYIDSLPIEKFNKVQEVVGNQDSIIFISSAITTRKDINLKMQQSIYESIFTMHKIPEFTFIRVYTEEYNELANATLEPILVVGDQSEPKRVRRGNNYFNWLGYLVPTHLLLLYYGSVIEQLSHMQYDS